MPVRFRVPGETPYLRHGDAVLTQLEVKQRFGEFAYRDTGGDVEIEPAWVANNVVPVDGTFGATRCHRGVAELVTAAVDELRINGKQALAASDPAAGCWVLGAPQGRAGRRHLAACVGHRRRCRPVDQPHRGLPRPGPPAGRGVPPAGLRLGRRVAGARCLALEFVTEPR
ncbi:MAG TPA: hypothetical protein VMQ81_03695 [Acidimicrobiia bacterium]|nr:hypothetical protein [Acidimicrobiia bacterium]